ncbi:NUDIX hydrolase [Streptacidiphilus anmyonensis]|uniref:NUDIX hydrolase n=1 Tax=Streptacidiphilus anmyonensis TaxID=405782 RepID=UPI0005A952A2|nr:NUDIX hydrolase [Streptacidiphilus anmyonensis]
MTEQEDIPFGRVAIRVGALVFCGGDVALLRRERATSIHYTPPGGNVEPGEDLLTALARELEEELALPPGRHTPPELLWVADQRVTRPGRTPSPRKLHLVYRMHITEAVRALLATEEHDELPDGSTEIGHVDWIDYRRTADLPIFPPLGPALAALASPTAAPATGAALPAVTDENYTWV